MNCRTCQYLGRHCGGLEGDLGSQLPSIDPMSLSSKQLLEIACALVRMGTVICDLSGVKQQDLATVLDPPYIWDTKED